MNNTLNKIISDRRNSIDKYKKFYSVDTLKKNISINKKYFDFKEKLNENKLSVVAEIKKASPSAGVIMQNYNPLEIAKKYLSSGATCLSVLTEENYFMGNIEHIRDIKKEVNLPILCKDFFIDPYQVYLARSFGADAILIILAALNDKTSKDIYNVAEDLKISTIVEVHTKDEAEKALNFKNAIIGINNRNLKTLKTDIKITFELHKILNKHKGPIICESGIKSEKQVEEIVKKTKINNFLIGESLLKDLGKNSSLLERIVKIRP